MKHLFTLLFSLCLVGQAVGQEARPRGSGADAAPSGAQTIRTIRGQVLDESGQPLVGATVAILDANGATLAGTYTDAEGRFSLQVNNTATRIRTSFVGAQAKVVPIGAAEEYQIQMQSDVSLSEVVVTGYGTQLRRDAAGAFSTVSGAKLADIPVASFDAALQGQVAGVQVVQSNGIPGTAVRVRIRGAGSLGGRSEPLYVIDGVPIISYDNSDRNFNENPSHATNTNPLADINPNDIESYTVLKDAYAAAKYGARGANGVIVITTKRGRQGNATFDVSYQGGFVEATRKLPLLNGPEWLALRGELYSNQNGGAQMPADFPVGQSRFGLTAGTIANTDWLDLILRRGAVHELNASVRGGTERSDYYISIGYLDQDGFLLSNNLERISSLMKFNFTATDKIKMGAQAIISRTVNNQPRESYTGGIGDIQRFWLNIYPERNADGSYFGSQVPDDPNAVRANPIAVAQNESYVTTNYRVFPNVFLTWEIIPGLEWRSEFGVDFQSQTNLATQNADIRFVRRRVLNPDGTFTDGDWVGAGAFNERRLQSLTWNTRHFATWNTTFGEEHRLQVVGGFEANYFESTFTTIYTNGFAGLFDPYFRNFSGAFTNLTTGLPDIGIPNGGGYNGGLDDRVGFTSGFLFGDYTFRDRYTLGVSIRADASSRFGENNRVGYFPAVSLGWIVSDESFFNVPWMNYLKMRASFGLTGNSEIGNFRWAATFSGAGGYLGLPGQALTRLPNPDLTWESNRSFNIAADFALFDNRIEGSIDAWHRISEDLLLEQSVPSSTGFSRLQVNSDVEIRNIGLDVFLKGRVMNAESPFQWSVSANLSFLENEVLSTGGLGPDAFPAGEGDARVLTGYPAGVSFLVKHAYIDPATGDEYFYDLEGNAVRGPIRQELLAYRQPVGNPFPWLSGGLTNDFQFMNFDLSVLLTFQVGNTIYDDGAKYQVGDIAGSNQRREILDRWTPTNTDGTAPRLGFVTNFDLNNSTRFLYDGDFLRLRTVTLGYSLPTEIVSRIGLTRLRVYVTGQNLYVWTKYPGWDPEIARYANSGNPNERNQQSNISFAAPYLGTPQARTVLGGIQLSF